MNEKIRKRPMREEKSLFKDATTYTLCSKPVTPETEKANWSRDENRIHMTIVYKDLYSFVWTWTLARAQIK